MWLFLCPGAFQNLGWVFNQSLLYFSSLVSLTKCVGVLKAATYSCVGVTCTTTMWIAGTPTTTWAQTRSTTSCASPLNLTSPSVQSWPAKTIPSEHSRWLLQYVCLTVTCVCMSHNYMQHHSKLLFILIFFLSCFYHLGLWIAVWTGSCWAAYVYCFE